MTDFSLITAEKYGAFTTSQGQEKQARRSNMYSKFLEMKQGTLLTTGLAERGWDIPSVHWIIQYDPPHKPEVFHHF
ncbi:ATP-dependent RNA helicase HAS1 [Portunus trituberculatus]|uniref:ATP-dependent RNA helicase HAS1 n=1 Tax=Portunus trituberculatus TaxID=210409 RepID=A0A5B7H2M8_PORTR|nr:ATP-dependent RNA helicase HAS1 [Portunus trituberculatus]